MWLITHSDLGVFLHNSDFSDTQQPILCRIKNFLFSLKAPSSAVPNSAVSGQAGYFSGRAP